MRFIRRNKKPAYKQPFSTLVSLLLVCAFLFVPISHTLERQEVEAGGAMGCPKEACQFTQVINTVKNTLSTIANKATAFFTGSDFFKEDILDSLAWFLINRSIELMAADIINWINNGFEGDPAFVTDLRGHLLQIADETAGAFIYGTKLGFLCSPFELDVRGALALQYADGRDLDVQCTLSGAVSHMDAFMEGDFLAGSWDGWFRMTQRPENNPYGALVLAQDELSVRLRNAKGEEIKLLDYGRGFLSYKSCETVEGGEVEPGTGNVEEKCEISTPGAVIQDQLNQALNLPRDRLIVADEFNEILSALFNQLVTQMFQVGVTGLSSSDSNEPYTDQLKLHAEEATQEEVNSEDYVGVPEKTPEFEGPEYKPEDEIQEELEAKQDEALDNAKKEGTAKTECEEGGDGGLVCETEIISNEEGGSADGVPSGEGEGGTGPAGGTSGSDGGDGGGTSSGAGGGSGDPSGGNDGAV